MCTSSQAAKRSPWEGAEHSNNFLTSQSHGNKQHSSQNTGKGNLFGKMQKKTASGETRILWDNPIFHNFQESCTKAWKTTSTKAFNSSVLPAYHLNKSVSGETKDKEKLPVVPDSLCSRGCWKKTTKTPEQDIFSYEVGGRKRGGEGISPETLEARTIRTFLHFVWKWISSALPAGQQSSEMLLLSASYWISLAWEEAKASLHHFPPCTLWNPPKLNCFQLVSSWISILLVGFKKKNKYFPTFVI